MSSDHSSAERAQRPEGERRVKLAAARALLATALEMLDEHGRSPAAATVDLAIHHIDGELDG